MAGEFDQIPPPPDDWFLSVAGLGADEVDLGQSLEALEYRERLTGVEQLEHELKVERSMLTMRKWFAGGIFVLALLWLGFIGCTIDSAGRAICREKAYHLSDPVLIALITTTTVNVLGVFYIVARWLFPLRNGALKERVPGKS